MVFFVLFSSFGTFNKFQVLLKGVIVLLGIRPPSLMRSPSLGGLGRLRLGPGLWRESKFEMAPERKFNIEYYCSARHIHKDASNFLSDIVR